MELILKNMTTTTASGVFCNVATPAAKGGVKEYMKRLTHIIKLIQLVILYVIHYSGEMDVQYVSRTNTTKQTDLPKVNQDYTAAHRILTAYTVP